MSVQPAATAHAQHITIKMMRRVIRSRIMGMTYADVLLWVGLLLFIASSGLTRLHRVDKTPPARPNVTVYPASAQR